MHADRMPASAYLEEKEMLQVLEEFRSKLDDVMHQCMDRRIVIYGYGYSGRFVSWYADYYHSLRPDYIITEEYSNAIPYDFPLFRSTLFDFGYKDVKDAVVWLCTAETEEIKERLAAHGYVKGRTYFNMNEIVYGEAYDRAAADTNVQFMRFLEQKYGCDVVEPIVVDNFTNAIEGMHPCVNSSPKEIFPLLDRCHCLPQEGDAIFDFGCGKGTAMLSFLDYGFSKVGGVEYADNVYQILASNFEKLGVDPRGETVTCIHGDAAMVQKELDAYNWFYFFDPFGRELFQKVIDNICASIERKPRKVHIINILPRFHQYIQDTGKFVLTNQFDIMTRQRVVDVFVSDNEVI